MVFRLIAIFQAFALCGGLNLNSATTLHWRQHVNFHLRHADALPSTNSLRAWRMNGLPV
jgi:hypothetical protein